MSMNSEYKETAPAGSQKRGSIASLSQRSSLEVYADGAYSVLILSASNHL